MIEASPRGAESASRAVSDALAARLVHRDLAAEPLPHLDGATLRAIGALAL